MMVSRSCGVYYPVKYPPSFVFTKSHSISYVQQVWHLPNRYKVFLTVPYSSVTRFPGHMTENLMITSELKIMQQLLSISKIGMSFLLLFASLPCLAVPIQAKADTGSIPAHAHARVYTSGWVCNQGYRNINDVCTKIKIPAHAFATNSAYGQGWGCRRGYLEKGQQCVKINVPENAYLTAAGDDWNCDRGYRETDGQCVKIKVPKHAFLTDESSGSGWYCGRGYQADGNQCIPVHVPAHAYLNESGERWFCEHGYRESNGTCAAIKVPAHGYLNDTIYGPGWKCLRGYHAVNGHCAALQMPKNAHIDYSGNNWECDKPYDKRQNSCALSRDE